MKSLTMMLAMLTACSSTSSAPGTDGGHLGDGVVGQPPRPHAVCGVAPAAELGRSCSASGHGDLCTSTDTKCGTLSCVIDARDGSTDTYCAPGCSTANDCPLGYACVDQHPQCVGAVTGKVCAQLSGTGCSAVALPAGSVLNQAYAASLFEDRASRRYLVAGSYQSTGALYQQAAGSWTLLLSWSDGQDATAQYVKDNGTATLVALGQRMLLIASGAATEETRPSSNLVVGVDASGSFVGLETGTGSSAYATVYRREAASQWLAVGPTSKKLVHPPSSLERGFVGVCGSPDAMTLCTSVDGQAFEPLAPPPVTGLTLAGAPAAGHSPKDFYVVLSGALHHFRGGKWVKEGMPAGYIPDGDAWHVYHGKTVQVMADGSVVYGRDNSSGSTSDITTFVLTGDCWQEVNVRFPAVPWGGALAWFGGTSELCVLPTR